MIYPDGLADDVDEELQYWVPESMSPNLSWEIVQKEKCCTARLSNSRG